MTENAKKMEERFPRSKTIPLRVGIMGADYSAPQRHVSFYGKNTIVDQSIIYSNFDSILKEKYRHFNLEEHRKDNYKWKY